MCAECHYYALLHSTALHCTALHFPPPSRGGGNGDGYLVFATGWEDEKFSDDDDFPTAENEVVIFNIRCGCGCGCGGRVVGFSPRQPSAHQRRWQMILQQQQQQHTHCTVVCSCSCWMLLNATRSRWKWLNNDSRGGSRKEDFLRRRQRRRRQDEDDA